MYIINFVRETVTIYMYIKTKGATCITYHFFFPVSLSVLLQVHGEVSSAFVGMSLSLRKELRSLVVDLPSGERLLLKGAPTEHSSLQRYKPFPEN